MRREGGEEGRGEGARRGGAWVSQTGCQWWLGETTAGKGGREGGRDHFFPSHTVEGAVSVELQQLLLQVPNLAPNFSFVRFELRLPRPAQTDGARGACTKEGREGKREGGREGGREGRDGEEFNRFRIYSLFLSVLKFSLLPSLPRFLHPFFPSLFPSLLTTAGGLSFQVSPKAGQAREAVHEQRQLHLKEGGREGGTNDGREGRREEGRGRSTKTRVKIHEKKGEKRGSRGREGRRGRGGTRNTPRRTWSLPSLVLACCAKMSRMRAVRSRTLMLAFSFPKIFSRFICRGRKGRREGRRERGKERWCQRRESAQRSISPSLLFRPSLPSSFPPSLPPSFPPSPSTCCDGLSSSSIMTVLQSNPAMAALI